MPFYLLYILRETEPQNLTQLSVFLSICLSVCLYRSSLSACLLLCVPVCLFSVSLSVLISVSHTHIYTCTCTVKRGVFIHLSSGDKKYTYMYMQIKWLRMEYFVCQNYWAKNMTCAPYITFKNSQKRTQHCNAPSNDAKFTSVTSEIRLHGLSPFLFTFLKQVWTNSWKVCLLKTIYRRQNLWRSGFLKIPRLQRSG